MIASRPNWVGEPRDAGVRIQASRQRCRQQREVGARAVDPLVEQPARSADRRAEAQAHLHVGRQFRHRGAEAPPRRSVFTLCTDLERQLSAAAARQLQFELRLRRRDRDRRMRKLDVRRAHDVVQAAIRQLHGLVRGPRRQDLAARFADRSLHFEDVGEVRRVDEQQRHLCVAVAEVGERQLLVPAAAPQQAITLDVDHAFRNCQLAGRGERPVREMRSEQRVVVIDRRAEQRGAAACDEEIEARQHARVVREQPVVLPPGCRPVRRRAGRYCRP